MEETKETAMAGEALRNLWKSHNELREQNKALLAALIRATDDLVYQLQFSADPTPPANNATVIAARAAIARATKGE